MGFFEDYFLNHFLRNGGFNTVDTLTYGALMIVVLVAVYKMLKVLKIQIDRKFFVALVPFMVFAPITRAYRDYIYNGIMSGVLTQRPAEFLTNLGVNFQTVYTTSLQHVQSVVPVPGIPEFYSLVTTYFVTPGSHLITLVLGIVSLFIGLGVQRVTKIQYWKTMFILGLVFLSITLVTPIAKVMPLLQVLGIAVPIIAGLFIISWVFKKHWPKGKEIINYVSTGILSVHILDAAATSTAINFYNFSEQHVVGGAFFNNLGGFYGSIAFFLSKIIVVYLAVWMFRKDIKNPELRNVLIIVVFMLGLAPAFRDITSMLIPSFYG